MISKKTISPIVSISLLLIVTTISVVGFQSWFNTYSSITFSNVEQESKATTSIDIVNLVGETLYLKNANTQNITISSVKISGIDCHINDNISQGISNYNLNQCDSTIPKGENEVVIYTNKGVYSKKIYFKNELKNLSLNSGYNEYIVSLSPVNWWRLGENSGNAIDEMGEYNLIWDASPTYSVAGAIISNSDTAVTLDGSTQRAQIAASGYRSSDYAGSVAIWYKTTSVTTSDLFTAGQVNYYDFAIDIDPSGTPYLWQRNGMGTQNYISMLGVSGTNDGNWHHLVVTSNGTAYKLYLDGIQKTNSVNAGADDGKWFADTSNLDTIIIGGYRAASERYYDGTIDEVTIFNYELSTSQVSEIYTKSIS